MWFILRLYCFLHTNLDDEDGSDEEKEDDDNESDSDDDDESDAEQDKGEVNAELFSAVKSALGKAALEDSGDEDGNDDEVLHIDLCTEIDMPIYCVQYVFLLMGKGEENVIINKQRQRWRCN